MASKGSDPPKTDAPYQGASAARPEPTTHRGGQAKTCLYVPSRGALTNALERYALMAVRLARLGKNKYRRTHHVRHGEYMNILSSLLPSSPPRLI